MQAALRENAKALAAVGLGYPVFEGIGNEKGAEIGQGNGLGLATSPTGEVEMRLRMIDQTSFPAGIVLSSEEFFPRFSMNDDPGRLVKAFQAADFDRVKILLFIRNPVGHAASLWQQYLKTAGGTAPIEAFFEKYSVPARVALFLEKFGSLEHVDLTCLSYDRHRHRLLSALEEWLGLPRAALAEPVAATVNRGLTWAELALQLALNRRIGKSGRILSDALCVELPDLKPDRIRPAPACQRTMCERLAPVLERVNAQLPEEERYWSDIDRETENPEARVLQLCPEQIELVGAALGSEIRRLRQARSSERRAPQLFPPFENQLLRPG